MSNEMRRGNRLLHMGCWCGVLVALLLENKALAAFARVPSDVPPVAWGGYTVAEDLESLLLYGALLGYLAAVDRYNRFAYLFGRWWFGALLALSGPAFSALVEIPALQHSLSEGGGAPAGFVAALALLAAAALAIGVWHVRHALRCERALLVEWVSGLLVVLAFYLAVSLPLLLYGGGDDAQGRCAHGKPVTEPPRDRAWHVHHGWLAWVLAIGCRWNHPASAAPLAVLTGVFVQGLALYSPVPLVT